MRGGRDLKALVTGGAGFIGSSLCEALVRDDWEVVVIDNMRVGSRKNLSGLEASKSAGRVRVVVGDCNDVDELERLLSGCDVVFHLAANPEVRMELNNPTECFRQNVQGTYGVLEAFSRTSVKTIVFTSTSAVYGDAVVRPTPENYSPMVPISLYAGSKLASEAMISSYCHTYNKHGIVLRLANILGPRSTHGVVVDFVSRLRKNPRELQILGDGQQTKSYTHIDDCITSILVALNASKSRYDVYNVGSEDQISATEIAKITADAMELKNTMFKYHGGLSDGRGWVGDVKNMLLDVSKLKAAGWAPHYNSRESVRLTVKALQSGQC